MGLDYTDLVMGIEEATGVPIPNDVAARLTTPRQLIGYLHGQLPQGPSNPCLSQRAFYALRRVLGERLRLSRGVLRPTSELASLLPPDSARAAWAWAEVGRKLGVPRWPGVRSPGWFSGFFQSRKPRTLGETAGYVAGNAPRAIKPAGEGWSWREVEAVVAWQFDYHLGIRGYSLDDRFVEDLGLE